MPQETRLAALDGLRGIAILLVMGFHYFACNFPLRDQTDTYPYGSAFSSFPLFHYGFLGVDLFFMVSGFVIALTLEGCANPVDFAVRRFARIWPALILYSMLTFLVIKFVSTPFSRGISQSPANFLPSWSLTPNFFWSLAFPNVDLIDGVYWSLVVEIRFYLFAGIIYWSFARSNLARNLTLFTLLVIVGRFIVKRSLSDFEPVFSQLLIANHLPWFSAGAIFYEHRKERIDNKSAVGLLSLMFVLIARMNTFTTDPTSSPMVLSFIALTFFWIFWAITKKPALVRFLESPVLVFIGICSYSVYLLHNHIGLSIISAIPKTWPPVVATIVVVLIISGMIGVGFAGFRLIEQPARRSIQRRWSSTNCPGSAPVRQN